MMSKTFEEFPVYQSSLRLAKDINSLCASTKNGQFNFLKNQIRRASTSILLNIAEGSGKWNKKDKINFYRMSQASANECSAAIDLFVTYELTDPGNANKVKKLLKLVINELQSLIFSIEKRAL